MGTMITMDLATAPSVVNPNNTNNRTASKVLMPSSNKLIPPVVANEHHHAATNNNSNNLNNNGANNNGAGNNNNNNNNIIGKQADPKPDSNQTSNNGNIGRILSEDEERVLKLWRKTKLMFLIILALLALLIALVLFERPLTQAPVSTPVLMQQQPAAAAAGANVPYQHLYPAQSAGRTLGSMQHRHVDATGSGQVTRSRQDTAPAGKLDTSSSDDHYERLSLPSTSTSDDDNGSDNDNNNDTDPDPDDSNDPNHIPADISVQPPPRWRHRPTAHQHGRPALGVPKRDPNGICMSSGCVKAAAQILNNMDNKTQPCEDFYQFACGRWIETQIIPDDKTSLSVFSQNTANLNIKLRALIERAPSKSDPPIVGQMRNMYTSCMNLTDIEARGDQPLLEALEDFGGWPVVSWPVSASTAQSASADAPSGSSPASTVPERQFNWLDTLIKFRSRGFSHDVIIDLSVVPDVRNSRRYIIELDQSSLGLPDRSYYFKGLNDTTVAAYINFMVDAAIMLGARPEEAKRQMSDAFEFEVSLAKISIPREQRRNVTRLYNKMFLKDLYKLAPNIDWPRYLSTLLKNNQLSMDKDEVIVKVPQFLRQIDQLLIKTDPRILANYLMWRVVRHSMGSLSKKWRDLAHRYNQITTGRQTIEPRWEQCLSSLESTLGTALSALYVKNHFNEHSKAAAMEMVTYIREEFLKILDEVDWMDDETREEAKMKARAIAPYIGYPDELLRDELVEELYKGIRLNRINFYENVRSLRIWSTDYAFGQLRKPNVRGDWKKHARAAVVNAFYNSLENSIEFPASILQGAFFDAERPNYMNFGAIGYVIGHEITHGFDDRGRQFDKDGNERNWWKPKTDARFKERAQCIIEQYGNYTVGDSGLKVNGLNTQGENIADNGGIKEAYRAYRRWTKDHGNEKRLPGLDYTPDQLFWISAANIWCGKFRPEVLKLRINSGVHSPSRFRIIGPLSNSEDFARSFNCPAGSPMNPNKKCSVW